MTHTTSAMPFKAGLRSRHKLQAQGDLTETASSAQGGPAAEVLGADSLAMLQGNAPDFVCSGKALTVLPRVRMTVLSEQFMAALEDSAHGPAPRWLESGDPLLDWDLLQHTASGVQGCDKEMLGWVWRYNRDSWQTLNISYMGKHFSKRSRLQRADGG